MFAPQSKRILVPDATGLLTGCQAPAWNAMIDDLASFYGIPANVHG